MKCFIAFSIRVALDVVFPYSNRTVTKTITIVNNFGKLILISQLSFLGHHSEQVSLALQIGKWPLVNP